MRAGIMENGIVSADEEIYKVANSRLDRHKIRGMYVVNYFLNPTILAKNKGKTMLGQSFEVLPK